MWDPAEDAYLAGLADGEGAFFITKKGVPRFHIKLRADDSPLLRQLHATFGGSVGYVGRDGDVTSPSFGWGVFSKRDLLRVLVYFDRFPLHGKKSGDYRVWREAVLVYLEKGAGRTSGGLDELLALRGALQAQREYSPERAGAPPALRSVRSA